MTVTSPGKPSPPKFDWSRNSDATADVCLIVEGCYPYVPGGVSGWIDWLIRTQPDRKFSVVSLWPAPDGAAPRYAMPDNVISFAPLYLQDFGDPPQVKKQSIVGLDDFANRLAAFMGGGGATGLTEVIAAHRRLSPRVTLSTLFNSAAAWDLVSKVYRAEMPYGSFLHFFWAWRALMGGLFSALEFKLPRAKVYHTISTGYAGVFAARARLETGRPMLLTEHGIYTNERRIELLMADWVADTLDKGHQLVDPRQDIRDIWITAFEAYARTCYQAADQVITLYEDNQLVQQILGADPATSLVIANGIATDRFAGLQQAGPDARPTIALIGRVVPIKDVKCFIAAANILRRQFPDLRAYVMGPTEEDQGYTEECKAMVAELGLDATVEFTGAVNITEYLPKVHVVVLTSLSESQPLTLLEAGAAGIPFVATNVGSCREIIEGRSDEQPPLGRGGFVTNVVAPGEIAEAVAKLLADHELRHQYGETLRARVLKSYRSEQAAKHYADLYDRFCNLPDRTPSV